MERAEVHQPLVRRRKKKRRHAASTRELGGRRRAKKASVVRFAELDGLDAPLYHLLDAICQDAKTLAQATKGPKWYPTNLGHIAVFTRDPEKDALVPVAAVPANELEEFLRRYQKHLGECYASVNQFYGGKHWARSPISGKYSLPRHDARSLRWLTTCFIDLDLYNVPGITIDRATRQIIAWQARGIIPPVSMILHSGRGLWAYWFLGPVERASQSGVRRYVKVQRAIKARFASLGAEANDASRCCRIPGSRNPKAPVEDQQVRTWIQQGEHGTPITYTLESLEHWFGTDRPEPTRTSRPSAGTKNADKQHARKEMLRHRLTMLLALAEDRGRIRRTQRWHFMRIVATTLRSQGRLTFDRLVKIADRCLQDRMTFRDSEIRSLLTVRPDKFRNQTIANLLHVTRAEHIALRARYPGKATSRRVRVLPPADEFGSMEEPCSPRQKQRAARRAEVRRIMEASDGLTLKAIALLVEKSGMKKPSHETIRQDLVYLASEESCS